MLIDTFSLEQLGFILCDVTKVDTVRVIFFAKTPYNVRHKDYYRNMMTYILYTLYKNNIEYEHLIIDWAPERFKFIPEHNKHNPIRNILYVHVYE